ncbi:hypothetical protein AB7M69_011030 [Bradyrhizobium japonicum]
MLVRNYCHRAELNREWSDVWSAQCDDDCPAGHFKFLRVWSVKFLHPRGRTRDC